MPLAAVSEDQLGFFGFTPEGSLVVSVPREEDGSREGEKVVIPTGFPDFRYPLDTPTPGPQGIARANLAAIRTLRQIQAEGRSAATAAEQEVLAGYLGWGRIPQVFVEDHPDFGSVGRELRALVTPAEWSALEGSTPNANHTPPEVIRGVYRLLARLGVEGAAWNGLHALEPGMGTGAFLGFGPPQESGVRWTGVELEPVAGAIARLLYPSADVRIGGFEHTVLPRNAFDLVVGNVPFGSYAVHDPVFNPRMFSIHNYFIAKSVALARPGGIIALVTSRYTMDQRDSTVRRHLAEHADLVAAVRLPDTAFRRRAVQRVTTDLLLLRRRAPGEGAEGAEWMETVEVETPDGPARVNAYFAEHPEMMAGKLRLTGKSQFHSDEPACVLPATKSLEAEFERIAGLLPEDVYESRGSARTLDFADAELAAGLADGAYKVVRGRLRRWASGRWVYHGFRNERDVYQVVALCAVRDAQREVLRTQNQECPEEEQDAARAALNRAYDTFVRQYGPINLEQRVEDGQGRVSIRRPNLEPFRGDPYAMNVAALEEYDAETRTVRKAPIFSRRVVRPQRIVERAETAEDALLLCLDRAARVDVGVIARLWGRSEDEVVRELQGRIFLNPATTQWETDDQYLSGHVRAKLRDARAAAAEDPRFEINVHALELAQPEDVGPADIQAALGAPWIEPRVVLEFVRHLLELQPGAKVEIGHVAREATWVLRADRTVRQSVRATEIWGTPRAHAIRLVEDLLNQRSTVIYDHLEQDGKEVSLRNSGETLSAQEKSQAIADEFTRWVWADAERGAALARRYNDLFNDQRPRDFDGSHLTFPGLSAERVPDPHQANAVWRILASGSTGIAHPVGAGKTLLAALASMRMRQLGLGNKVLHATMGHMLEQYAREFLQAYPQARLLTAHIEDVSSRDKRRLFFARAASGEYDAILVTHAAFEKLGMSAEYERTYLEGELDAFEKLLAEAKTEWGERSLTVKQLKVYVKQYEARLRSLSSRDKDDNLTFEELGIDFLFVDEIHLYKNAATRTKIEGIPRAARPSKRSADLMMKASYLNGLRGRGGIVGMTGTLIANTIAELHVHLRYLAPGLLRRYHIEHFDAFAANFIKRTWALEISPDGGGFRPRERFHFKNVPELLAIVSQSVDIQVAEPLYEGAGGEAAAEPADTLPAPPVALPSIAGARTWPSIRVRPRGPAPLLKLPRPRLFGGRPAIVSAPPSNALLAYTEELVARAERIRDPQDYVDPSVDNMLLVTSDGRKASLDMRLIYPGLPDDPDSKVNALVRDVFDTWDATRRDRSTQLVFCDLSAPRTDGRFSVYNEVRDKLVAMGIPAHEIAFAQDASTPRKKAALQAAIRSGLVRVTLASTFTMGTGTNCQDRIIAIHHLDAPWRPSDVEQRDGRGARRGNRNPFLHLKRYVTERSFDVYIWTLLHYKLEMINRVMLGDPSVREIADNDGVALSYAEVKAIATGNPLILENASVEAEITRLKRAEADFHNRRFRLRANRAEFPRRLASAREVLALARADLARREPTGDDFRIVVGETEYRDRAEGGVALRQHIEQACHASRGRGTVAVGRFAGFELLASVDPRMQGIELVLRGARDYREECNVFQNPLSLVHFLEVLPYKIHGIVEACDAQVAHLAEQVAQLERFDEVPFPHAAKLAELKARHREIGKLLHLGEAHTQDIGALRMGEDDPEGESEEELFEEVAMAA